MEKFVVRAEADLTFEVEADNEEMAINLIANAFRLVAPTDPLANIKVSLDGATYGAELKTTIIQDWSVERMEVEKL